MWKSITATKLEAAERQLRQAIELFFEARDPVSTHTLVAAASGVLGGLASKRGIERPVRDRDLVRDDRRAEFVRILNQAQNFFKHADNDPDATLEFRKVRPSRFARLA